MRETEHLFDGADSSLILPRRSASISSLQSLFFLNSEHVRISAEKLALRLHRLPDDAARIKLAYRMLYARDVTADELQTGLTFLDEWSGGPPPNQKPPKNGPPPEVLAKWRVYLQALLATNEFLFVD